jgi:UDP-N-acetylmuramate--alanine ligase
MKHFSRTIHLIGIGGAGMSGLAELLSAYGHTVTGSDRTPSAATARLEKLGVEVQYNHIPVLVKKATLVIYSSAIKPENQELIFAGEHGIPVLRRAEALGELMRAYTTVCISGTHGKTTTTSLVGAIFGEAGLQPTVIVGGTLMREGAPVVIGASAIMVAEADEYDRSFLAMYPTVAIVTNVEADHLDCYADLEDIKNTFVTFAGRVPFYGAIIGCIDDAGVREILPQINRRCLTYGLSEGADYQARDIEFTSGRPSYIVYRNGKPLGRIQLAIPGMHNVVNSLGAVVAGLQFDVPFERIRTALERFGGVKRRFEIIGSGRGVTVVDDYAHHPGEIAATLDAARRSGFKRITAVFQPHLFTRTRDFLDGFAKSLSKADTVFVADIYKSREEPIPGVTAASIVKKMHEMDFKDAHYIARKEDIVKPAAAGATDGDAIIVMGAGDITETAGEILKELRHG